jgi:hypothetical protein
MSLLGGFRADQLINQLIGEEDPTSPAAQKTVEKLKKIGPKVIPKVIDALAKVKLDKADKKLEGCIRNQCC